MTQTLYVGNLAFTCTQDQLMELFAPFGPVTDVKIITNRDTGRSRGFAFVEVEKAEEAIAALNQQEWLGRPLVVKEARPKTENPDRSSDRRSYGR